MSYERFAVLAYMPGEETAKAVRWPPGAPVPLFGEMISIDKHPYCISEAEWVYHSTPGGCDVEYTLYLDELEFDDDD